jgi:hypothetical protein
MYRFSFTASLFLVSTLFTQAIGESPNDKSKTISLDKIWAYEMPGTRDVRELEPKLDVHNPGFKELWERSIVRQITSFLCTNVPDQGEVAGPAFVVVGAGKGALTNAFTTLTDRERNKQ